MGGLTSIISSQPPFRDLELDPLIETLLPQCFRGIILSKKYKNQKNQNQNKIKDEKPIDKVAIAIRVENFCRRRQLNQEIYRKKSHQKHGEDPNIKEHSETEISNTHIGTLVEKIVEKDYRMNTGTKTLIEQFQLKPKKKFLR